MSEQPSSKERVALHLARKALAHLAPENCWATGPATGDPIEDLIVCPGCRALSAIDAALRTTPEPTAPALQQHVVRCITLAAESVVIAGADFDHLRRLADAIEYLEALKGFDYQVRGDEIRIEWTTGSSCGGYTEMRKALAVVVSERYQGLRLEAIAAAEKRVAELRAELNERPSPGDSDAP